MASSTSSERSFGFRQYGYDPNFLINGVQIQNHNISLVLRCPKSKHAHRFKLRARRDKILRLKEEEEIRKNVKDLHDSKVMEQQRPKASAYQASVTEENVENAQTLEDRPISENSTIDAASSYCGGKVYTFTFRL